MTVDATHTRPAPPAAPVAPAEPPLEVRRRRFTVDEYYRMAEAGILRPDERLELVDGEIVEMSPIGPRHQSRVDRANRVFSRRAGDAAIVRVQGPSRLRDYSEPEPDLALLRPRDDFYQDTHPEPEDVLLIVEVADISLAYDRRVKLPLYARAGVPEAWLLDLSDPAQPALEVHRSPSPDGYQDVRRLGRGDRVAPLALPELELDVDELLG